MTMRLLVSCPHARRLGAAAVASALAVAALTGCLGEPKIEDRWTRLDFTGANYATGQMVPTSTVLPVVVGTDITYRSIVTGFLVVELRGSGTITDASVRVEPDAPREPMAADIDRILANSVSLGRATRAVTGWDHLIQHIDLSFNAMVPAVLDSASAASGVPPGVFLLCYLGAGDKIERADGSDTLIVTPFPSSTYQILPVGLELTPQ
jgi:hypothetical protein